MLCSLISPWSTFPSPPLTSSQRWRPRQRGWTPSSGGCRTASRETQTPGALEADPRASNPPRASCSAQHNRFWTNGVPKYKIQSILWKRRTGKRFKFYLKFWISLFHKTFIKVIEYRLSRGSYIEWNFRKHKNILCQDLFRIFRSFYFLKLFRTKGKICILNLGHWYIDTDLDSYSGLKNAWPR